MSPITDVYSEYMWDNIYVFLPGDIGNITRHIEQNNIVYMPRYLINIIGDFQYLFEKIIKLPLYLKFLKF